MDPKEIKRWMKNYVHLHVDTITGEVNATALVEAWDRACATGGDTLDPTHIAWDIAVDVALEYEAENE